MSAGPTKSNAASWWQRPAGGREVLNVALPLVVSSLSWTVMTFVDRMFLKWESGEAMAAAFSASTVWFAVLCLPLGICMYATTFVSQYSGSGQPQRVGPATWQGVWAGVLFSPLVLLAVPLAPAIFAASGHAPQTIVQETLYFRILCYGGPAMLIAQGLASFYSGRGQTSVVMWVDTSVAVVNLILDYCWIFGKGGFPAMGIAGAGWATVTALTLKAVIYAVLVLQRSHQQRFATLSGMRFDRRLFGRLLYFGTPSGLQLLLDVIGFTVFILLIGRLGTVEAEASSIAFSISTLAFMPIWGISQAVSILVGRWLGENRDDLAAQATWSTLWIALAYMAAISICYLFVPGMFLFAFFLGESSSTDQETVRTVATVLLRFVAAYNLFDAALMVFVSAIKGAGDTPFVLRVSLVMAGVLAGSSWFCVEVLQMGIYGCWGLITAWIWVLGMTFLARFLQGKWREMRVIEDVPLDCAAAEV